jgi:hypothetical protein
MSKKRVESRKYWSSGVVEWWSGGVDEYLSIVEMARWTNGAIARWTDVPKER